MPRGRSPWYVDQHTLASRKEHGKDLVGYGEGEKISARSLCGDGMMGGSGIMDVF